MFKFNMNIRYGFEIRVESFGESSRTFCIVDFDLVSPNCFALNKI